MLPRHTTPHLKGKKISKRTRLQGISAVIYDFDKNIAGIVLFRTSLVFDSGDILGLSFTESLHVPWISEEGCDTTAATIDRARSMVRCIIQRIVPSAK